MKIRNIFYIGLLFLISTLGFAQEIYLAGNGVTIIAGPTAVTGNSYLLGGINYMVVDNATIDAQVDAGNYNIVTTRVTDMSNQFLNKNTFNSDISHWDTSNVTNMDRMFSGAISFNQPIGIWDTSKVTSMFGTFFAAQNFNQPLGAWDTGEVTDMTSLFHGADVFNQDVNNWNTSNVVTMTLTFGGANVFNKPLNNWNTSNVVNMEKMFQNAGQFNQPLNNWNVSNVTNMSRMFWGAANFNENITTWNVSSVTDMSYMFYFAVKFDQPLNNWNVSNVTTMEFMFGKTGNFTQAGANDFNQDIGDWDVGKVQNFRAMFRNSLFNQDISEWDVSSATNMGQMFDQTGNFANQGVSLNCWDTSNVTNMAWMFYKTSFNQDISQWCVQLIGAAPNSFSSVAPFNGNAAFQPMWGQACSGNSVVISFDDETRTYGDTTSFTVTATSNQLGIPITYSIADTSIATIDGSSGEITIKKPGTTTVTASQNSSCISGSGNMTLTINKKDIDINADDIILTFGDLAYPLSATSSITDRDFTYTISDGSIASISGDQLSIIKAGSTSITITQQANDFYNPISKVINLTINKATPNLIFPEISKNLGDPEFSPTVTSSNTGLRTFSVSDTSIANSSGSSLTIVGVGQTLVSVTIQENENYLSISGTTTLTVGKEIQI